MELRAFVTRAQTGSLGSFQFGMAGWSATVRFLSGAGLLLRLAWAMVVGLVYPD